MTKEEKLYRLSSGTIVYLKMNTVDKILKNRGLNPGGDAQKFHTANVLKRIGRYMPYRTGMTYKATIMHTDINKPQIVTNTPYARYLFHGKVMVNAKTGKGPANIPGVGLRYKKGTVLKATDRPLEYTKTNNAQAGPRWDRALVAAEGKALVADLQDYIDRRNKS